jgi:hypothetical protein
VLTVLSALIMAGCKSLQLNEDVLAEESLAVAKANDLPDWSVLSASKGFGNDGSSDQPPPEPKVLTLQIDFSILRTTAPEGVFSESLKIWNLLDSEAIPAATTRLLAKNGVRVARGHIDAWVPIKALLDAQEDVTSSQSRIRVSNGYPLMLELDTITRDQTFFLFRPSGHLAGANYPGSRNIIRVEYTIPATAPADVVVEVMPEVLLTEARRADPQRLEDLFGPRTEKVSRIVRELAFKMQLSPDEFLAIGPNEAAHNGHLIGSLMLCEQREGTGYETMYFVTPRVVSTGRSLSQ